MAGDSIGVSDIVRLLPLKLQVRFNTLAGYVQGLIDEERGGQDKQIFLDADQIQVIQLAAFIFALNRFFWLGTVAARSAARSFSEFRAEGFQVGSSRFTENNENTLRGEVLAQRLQGVVNKTRLGRQIRRASSIRDLVATLVREYTK